MGDCAGSGIILIAIVTARQQFAWKPKGGRRKTIISQSRDYAGLNASLILSAFLTSAPRRCWSFLQENKCTKGDACTFAHGDHEPLVEYLENRVAWGCCRDGLGSYCSSTGPNMKSRMDLFGIASWQVGYESFDCLVCWTACRTQTSQRMLHCPILILHAAG